MMGIEDWCLHALLLIILREQVGLGMATRWAPLGLHPKIPIWAIGRNLMMRIEDWCLEELLLCRGATRLPQEGFILLLASQLQLHLALPGLLRLRRGLGVEWGVAVLQ